MKICVCSVALGKIMKFGRFSFSNMSCSSLMSLNIQQKENGSRAEWSAEREWSERRSHPPFGSAPDDHHLPPYDPSTRSRATERPGWDDDDAAADAAGNRPTRMQSLLATVDDLGRAMENLVVSVVYDSDQEQ